MKLQDWLWFSGLIIGSPFLFENSTNGTSFSNNILLWGAFVMITMSIVIMIYNIFHRKDAEVKK